jgi:hypothetical protein
LSGKTTNLTDSNKRMNDFIRKRKEWLINGIR